VPSRIVQVVPPPVLHHASDGHAQFKIAGPGFVGGAKLALDHDRGAVDIGAKTHAGDPSSAMVVVPPVMLHLMGGGANGDEFKITLHAVRGLQERCAAEGRHCCQTCPRRASRLRLATSG